MIRFRDSIYGYIEIEKGLIVQVIDTPAFQRLKDIIQTRCFGWHVYCMMPDKSRFPIHWKIERMKRK